MSNKTASITVRLTEEQKALVETAAKRNDMSITDFTKSALMAKTGDKSMCSLKDSESQSGYVNIDMMITKEQDSKVKEKAEELGITKQAFIRRLINEGNIYDLRINLEMNEEFLEVASEIRNMNRLLNGIYTVCKRTDGILTKHEVEHLYASVKEISEKLGQIRASVFRTSSELKDMAAKRMDKLIKEKTKGR